MFGSGWGWLVAATVALLAFMGLVKIMLDSIARIGDTEGMPIDPLDEELWHRFEEGDLTRPEFERLRRGHEQRRAA